ncbi:TIGR02757 family protein [Polluticoccus soli]|uniref:TIGR02757 family protein n=1 Tax=Polluticoccus soli TaxID=3034150 RepID=UPI0023E09B4D|nr:TIGR02757 family protein [Flavipsychrobacter sp. JY13-12]
MPDLKRLKNLLDEKVRLYNQPSFIIKDPISIPHRFSKKQDIEISGLFAAVLAWGNRTSIINNCSRLMEWMDNAPYEFILQHKDTDLKKFLGFAHRTFNATDLLYFIEFLQYHYSQHKSLEEAFVPAKAYTEDTVEQALIHFHNYFFSIEHPERTKKHISTPARKSACKRLNMYLRWMVRKDNAGVDFGIWKKIKPSQLVCPLDVHVARVAKRLELLENDKSNWSNALQLTYHLHQLNPDDPAVYDYALFGLGMAERF